MQPADESFDPSAAPNTALAPIESTAVEDVNEKDARGRPFRLDEHDRRIIIALVANGNSRITIARYVGCGVKTIAREAARDPEFAKELKRAECMAEVDSLRLIRRAAQSQWRAAAWMLERRNPEEFAVRPVKTLTLQWLEDAITEVLIELFDATDEQINRAVACVRERAGETPQEAQGERNFGPTPTSEPLAMSQSPLAQLPTPEELLEQFISGINGSNKKAGPKSRRTGNNRRGWAT